MEVSNVETKTIINGVPETVSLGHAVVLNYGINGYLTEKTYNRQQRRAKSRRAFRRWRAKRRADIASGAALPMEQEQAARDRKRIEDFIEYMQSQGKVVVTSEGTTRYVPNR